ncbi:MAG: tRNA uracil 4-sulfurtransferase ThiI [Bacilli bacterium]|jgi:thiamine biosynthesis protein ThiI
MNPQLVMIHFGELATKGKNRRNFVDTLVTNIRHRFLEVEVKITVTHDHIYLRFHDFKDEFIEVLQEISGIHAFSLILQVPTDTESLINTAKLVLETQQGQTFKVITKRRDKAYPLNSDQINRLIAGHILRNTKWKVDVHQPDFPLKITIDRESADFTLATYPGLGGYPLGAVGKALHLLSGGIDSPVAAYFMIRRGISLEMIHFAAPPYTQAAVIDKIKDLCRILNRYQPRIKLHIVPFTELQLAIYQHATVGYPITIMRRMMYRIAEGFARRNRLVMLSTGESLGQVSSQTPESLAVINDVTNLPIIRPLACMDKIAIIEMANRIGTYETSILPFDDCCTIFAPVKPKTKPRLREVEIIEAKWDYQAQIEACLNKVETITIAAFEKKSEYL